MKSYLGVVALFLIPVLLSAIVTWSIRNTSNEYSLVLGVFGALGMLCSAVWLALAITGAGEVATDDNELTPEEQEWLDHYFHRRNDKVGK